MNNHEVLARLGDAGLIAVLRGNDADLVADAALTLLDAGVRAIEITLTVPDACAALRRVVAHAGADAIIGAGTLREPAQIEQVIDAGAAFLVSPGVTPPLLEALAASGVPFLPGVSTASELMVAAAAGATAVKLFPGSLGGPGHLRALRGPFPDTAIMPTGGVEVGNIAAWYAAGAFAVGAGSDLAPTDMIAAGDSPGLTARAQAYVTAVADARTPSTSAA